MAKPMIQKMSQNTQEVGKLKSQLDLVMNNMQVYADNFETATPEQIKRGESGNALCGILMNVPELAKEGVDKGILDTIGKLWEKKNPKSKDVKEKKLIGKKKDKHLKSIDNICKNVEFILKDTDWNPRVADEMSKNSIFDINWRSFENLGDFEHQALNHARL